MGSFYGHLDSGVIFPLIGLWWTFNMFRDYRKSLHSGEPFHSRVSYVTTIRSRQIPLEIYLKIIFPFIAILGELFRNDFRVNFVDENNRFVRLRNLQHMTYFGLFCLHGITDLLSYYKVSPIMKEMKYITASVAWCWLGVQLYFHSSESTNKPPLENMIHRLSIPSNFIIACMMLWENQQREIITPLLIRCIMTLVLGIWSLQIPFILFEPFASGGNHNPAWNQTDMRNVHFVTALYGYDLSLGLLVLALVYVVMAIYDKVAGLASGVWGKNDSKGPHEYHILNGVGNLKDEGHKPQRDVVLYRDSLNDETSFD